MGCLNKTRSDGGHWWTETKQGELGDFDTTQGVVVEGVTSNSFSWCFECGGLLELLDCITFILIYDSQEPNEIGTFFCTRCQSGLKI